MNQPRAAAAGLVVAAAVCSGLCLASSGGAVVIAAGLPLSLYLPGASLVLAMDPGYAHVRGASRVMWAPLASFALLLVGGLILNEVAGLTRATWALYLFGVVVLTGVVTWWRGGSYDGPSYRWRAVVRRPVGLSLWSAGLLAGALVLVGGALALSVYSSATSNRERFVELWILPIPADAGADASRVQVGLTNDEGSRTRFEITVSDGDATVLNRLAVVLKAGQVWTLELARKGHRPMTARVVRASDPSKILDSVSIASPAT